MLAIKRVGLGLLSTMSILGIVTLVAHHVKAADELIREDTVSANLAGISYICGTQSVANEYNISRRWVTYSDSVPPHSVRYNNVVASAGNGGSFGEGCSNEDWVEIQHEGFFAATPGSKVRLWAPDTTPPTISNIAAGSITQTGATVTWTTNESATHTIKYGTSSGSYDSYPNSKSAGSGTSASGAL